jgi:beta-lactamase regulating signal transducer with metallopeptidase domain/tetratricopeptide (TPR) repeat protein
MTMTPNISSLLDSITTASLAWWLLRMTLVATLACAYLALARRARPALRHVVAVTSLVAIALLPVASALLPAFSVPILPASSEAIETPPASREQPFAIDAPVSDATPALSTASVAPATADPVRSNLAATLGRAVWSTLRNAVGSIDLGIAALLTWLTVAACLLAWTAIGSIGAWRLSRRTATIIDDEVLLECERARRVLGLQRTVDIGVSSDVAIPMVVGALRPRVVVPASAAAWSRERLRVVLLHELAHVRRHDGLWMLASRVVTSLLWFHPLLWVLSSHLRRDAERACDEIVLASGVRGSDYAEHLVDIARGAMDRRLLAGSVLALATRSSLESRVVAILATRVPRASSGRRLAAVAGAAVGLFVVIAAARPTSVVSAQQTAVDSWHTVESPAVAPAVELKKRTVVVPKFEFSMATAEGAGEEAGTTYYLAEKDSEGRSGGDWYSRGSELYDRNRFEKAAEAYQNAARLGYRRETALYNAGCSYALAKQTAKAVATLREAYDEGFDDPEQFAEDTDLNSLRADPGFQKLLNDVMHSGEAESERRAAMRDYERLTKDKDVEEGDWNSVGIDLLRSGDYDTAAKAFDNEFKVSKDEDALYNMACARALAGKSADALKLLEQSITTGSVNADHMAEDPDLMTLHSDARFDQLLDMADDLELNNVGWWKNLPGDWSWSSGKDERRWRKSIPHFEEMTRKYPKIGRAWSNLGFAQLAAQDAKASTPSFQKALDLGYRPSATMYNLACSEAQSGDVDAAIAWLEKADGAGFQMWSYARWDDDLDPLRDDPRFEKMEKRWKAEAKEKDKHDDDHDWDWDDDEDDDT